MTGESGSAGSNQGSGGWGGDGSRGRHTCVLMAWILVWAIPDITSGFGLVDGVLQIGQYICVVKFTGIIQRTETPPTILVQAAYNIRATATILVQAAYNIRTTATILVQAAYNIRATATILVQAAYNIRTPTLKCLQMIQNYT